jgi:hypothetical protein
MDLDVGNWKLVVGCAMSSNLQTLTFNKGGTASPLALWVRGFFYGSSARRSFEDIARNSKERHALPELTENKGGNDV